MKKKSKPKVFDRYNDKHVRFSLKSTFYYQDAKMMWSLYRNNMPKDLQMGRT
jgi:hypothetical protein